MKKVIKLVIGIGLLVIGVFLIKETHQSYLEKKKTGARIQTLQHCCFESLNGGQICIDEFDPKLPTVIIYFHPECEHCQYEAKEIGFHATEFSNANLIMVTPDDSIQRVKNFAAQNHLCEVGNFELLLDKSHAFKDYFGTVTIPSVFIYKNNKLLKKYSGETKIEAILKIINNN